MTHHQGPCSVCVYHVGIHSYRITQPCRAGGGRRRSSSSQRKGRLIGRRKACAAGDVRQTSRWSAGPDDIMFADRQEARLRSWPSSPFHRVCTALHSASTHPQPSLEFTMPSQRSISLRLYFEKQRCSNAALPVVCCHSFLQTAMKLLQQQVLKY